MTDRNDAKALLARVGVEVNNALKRVDNMSDAEVEETVTALESIRAIYDKNGSCGPATVEDLKAFYDKNGSCLGGESGFEAALRRATTKKK